VRSRLRRRRERGPLGGILTYDTERLLEEASYVAYHFHWPLADILDLEHPLRRAFIAQIGQINERLSAAADSEEW
jgi:hypothetical protein